jgi:hypothetical protein
VSGIGDVIRPAIAQHEPDDGDDYAAESFEGWSNHERNCDLLDEQAAMSGTQVPIRSMREPAGAFATIRLNRFALRMIPTRNGEIPRAVPRFGRIGKTTSPPDPTKNVLATIASTTDPGRFIPRPVSGTVPVSVPSVRERVYIPVGAAV